MASACVNLSWWHSCSRERDRAPTIANYNKIRDPLMHLLRFTAGKIARLRKDYKQRRNKKAIRASGLFDEVWYLRTYPDVIGYPDGALVHYLDYGGAEGRSAGPNFDAQAHLRANPEISGTGVNPLLHYIEHGGDGPNVPWLPDDPGGPLDIFDDAAVSAAVRMPLDQVTWRFIPSNMTPGPRSGIRIVVELLRRRRDLRVRFPCALRDGKQGAFATWVKTEGLRTLGLESSYAPWIDAAFDADPGAPARQVVIYNNQLRRDVPLFLLPSGTRRTCQTLFGALRQRLVTLENVWWFLIANSENPQAALCETWAFTPPWQAQVVDGGTVFGVLSLAEWVAKCHGCNDPGIFAQTYPTIMSDAAQIRLAYRARPAWRHRFPDALTSEPSARALLAYLMTGAAGLHWLPRAWLSERNSETLARDVVRAGVNVFGHFSYPSGLRVSAESMVRALSSQGTALSLRDVPVSLETDEPVGHHFMDCEIYDLSIVHVQPDPFFMEAYAAAGLVPRRDPVYRVAYWYWELNDVPESWNRAALQCDEIWTATEFIASGLRKRYKQPIHVLPPGMELIPFEPLPRSAFKLEADNFVIGFVFHMTSVMDRKNPLGLISAFKKAFLDERRARLVIKTCFGERHPASLALLEAAADDPRIILINEIWTHERTLALLASCDAYASLHRSEGLGLTMCEAMLLGRPVVATGFSGNVEFMNEHNSLLVDYDLVALSEDIPPYEAGQQWAEPSIEHAARLMRKLFEDPTFANDLGTRAKLDLERRFAHKEAGGAMVRRIAEILADGWHPTRTSGDCSAGTGSLQAIETPHIQRHPHSGS